MQKPIADKGMDCPLWQKDMSKVCHKCPGWTVLRGMNPNTGEEVDEWGCSLFQWLPPLLVENSQQSRQLGAAIESLRNEQVRISENMMKAAAIAAQQMKKLG